MVHFPGFAPRRVCIPRRVAEVRSAGLPHSEISGSMPVCGSPKLIAAVHVLHRLLAPRHPPYALSSFHGFIRARPRRCSAGAARTNRRLNFWFLPLRFTFSCQTRSTAPGGGPRPGRAAGASALAAAAGPGRKELVGLGRIELPTSPLSGVRSSQLSYRPGSKPNGGADRDRTDDLLIANQALSQAELQPRRRAGAARRRPVREFLFEDGGRRGAPEARGTDKGRSGQRRPGARRRTAGVDANLSAPGGAVHRRSQAARNRATFSLRKEVIQPQVLLRLPCYDFTPIMSHTLDGFSLSVRTPASSTAHFRDVTGGVYKARERIHRGVLIRDY